MRAAQLELDVSKIETLVDSESNDYGILGIDESIPAGPFGVSIRVRLEGAAVGDERYQELVAWAVDHCPVTDAVLRSIPIETEVELS